MVQVQERIRVRAVVRTNRGCRVRPQARRRRRKPGTAPGAEGSRRTRQNPPTLLPGERRASASRCDECNALSAACGKTGFNAARLGGGPLFDSLERKGLREERGGRKREGRVKEEG